MTQSDNLGFLNDWIQRRNAEDDKAAKELKEAYIVVSILSFLLLVIGGLVIVVIVLVILHFLGVILNASQILFYSFILLGVLWIVIEYKLTSMYNDRKFEIYGGLRLTSVSFNEN